MSIINQTRVVALTTQYLNLPVTRGIDPAGHWFYYTPANGGNTALGAKITPYQWGTQLPLAGGAPSLTIQGTMPLITEPWDGANVQYHGSSITHVGAGVNDITGQQESDAYFFAHLGALAASDDIYYWDRVYLPLGGSEWDYYQYHAHSPTFYVTYENGRQVMSGDTYIDPTNKAYGYVISSRVRISGTDYTSVLARVHTPSVGGAHNSHNDTTLPTAGGLNYLTCGIVRGIGERFHAFYITASGAQWEIFNRTYIDSASSFTAQVSLGVYDLADPTFVPGSNQQYGYPIRASNGCNFGARIYIPVILNNATSGFDLEIWSFNSLDTIAGGSLVRHVMAQQLTTRPDCYAVPYGLDKMFVGYTDTINGGIRIKSYDGATWTDQGTFVTNAVADPVRIHGFEFNSSDFKFYMLLSGNASGGANTYIGPGMYTFQLSDPFTGYNHLDYIASTNSFVERGPLTAGYLKYYQTEAYLSRINAIEPQAIGSGLNILDYGSAGSTFYNRRSTGFGGQDYYYHSITLSDGRRFAAGQVVGNPDNLGIGGDFLFSIYDTNLSNARHFAWGGAGADFFTGCWEDRTNKRIYLTGYSKSELVPKGEILIHGWARSLTDGSNAIQYKDLAIDSTGNSYCVGTHATGLLLITKYNSNYELQWQKVIGDGVTNTDIGNGIAVDSNGYVYVAGSTQETGAGITDVLLIKLDSNGNLIYGKVYGTAATQSANSVTIINKGGTDYVVMAVVSDTSTILLHTDTSGNIIEQNLYSSLTVNRVRPVQSSNTSGRYLFSGCVYTNSGETYTITNQGTNNYVWNGGIYVNTADPSPVTLYRGATYTFNLNASGHPFWIKTAQVTGTGSAYNTGVINNGAAIGTITFTVPLDAPSTLYYVCQIHIGMSGSFTIADNPSSAKFGMAEVLPAGATNMLWVRTYSSASSIIGYDIVNTTTATGGVGAQFAIVGTLGTTGLILQVTVNESAGLFTVTKAWAKTIPDSQLYSCCATPYTETTRYVYAVGYNNNSGIAPMGMDEGLLTRWLVSDGSLDWKNVFGHDMDERMFAVANDTTGLNIVSVGWSESHAAAAAGVIFRCPNEGYGTGLYTIEDMGTMPYYYNAFVLVASTNNDTLNNISTPSNNPAGFTSSSYSPTINDSPYSNNNFNGSFGPNGLFNFILGYIDLELYQSYINSNEYQLFEASNCVNDQIYYLPEWTLIGDMWEAGTVGDSSADDGNMFGYDIIRHSNGKVYAIGQTSGDITKTNTGGSGVYDYLLVEFDPITESFEWYQNGTAFDEETYALTELSNGKIAYTGRTTGTLGSPNQGGYDIFLGIFDTTTETSTYYSVGSGLDDKGLNVHDIGNNTLIIVYSTFGTLGVDPNVGSEDLGVIKFNYSTGSWGTAYQTGSTTSEIYEQNGKPSALIGNEKVAITVSSAGVFADNAVTFGYLDVCLAILNLTTGEWRKYQVGSTANEISSSCTSNDGQLLIGGNSGGSFDSDIDAIFVEFDGTDGIVGKSSSLS